jgi:hypothetical protein
VCIHAKIDQRADEHVAADAAEDIEVESLHLVEIRRAAALRKLWSAGA